MANKINSTNSERELIDEDVYQAVIDAADDLGRHKPFNEGEQEKFKHSFRMHLNKSIKNGPLAGKPHIISMIVTDSTHEKSKMGQVLRSFMPELSEEQLRKGDIDLDDLIGRNGLVSVVHKTNGSGTKAVIENTMKLPDGMELLQANQSAEVPQWVLDLQAQRLDTPEISEVKDSAEKSDELFSE